MKSFVVLLISLIALTVNAAETGVLIVAGPQSSDRRIVVAGNHRREPFSYPHSVGGGKGGHEFLTRALSLLPPPTQADR